MRTGSSRQFLSLAPQTLVVVGLILIVSALLDYTILLIPPNFLDAQWQIGFISQLVDRGIIPLVGLALLFAGLWTGNQISDRSNLFRLPLALPALILASLLGLIFLLAVPLHINNSLQERGAALERIEEEAQTTIAQLEGQIQAQVAQERQRINALLENQEALQQAIQAGQLSQDQAVLLQQFKTEPGSLETYLEDESANVREQAELELATQRAAAEKQIKESGWKSMVRTGANSLFLAIGYAIVGWTGLREAKN